MYTREITTSNKKAKVMKKAQVGLLSFVHKPVNLAQTAKTN